MIIKICIHLIKYLLKLSTSASYRPYKLIDHYLAKTSLIHLKPIKELKSYNQLKKIEIVLYERYLDGEIINDEEVPVLEIKEKEYDINYILDYKEKINEKMIEIKSLIDILNSNDKEDFLKYVRSETKFFPLSIFILKKKFFSKLCLSTFSWLKKCEKIFDKNKLKDYGEIRIFDFLAERYFSFWISKYCKHKIWPYSLVDTQKK